MKFMAKQFIRTILLALIICTAYIGMANAVWFPNLIKLPYFFENYVPVWKIPQPINSHIAVISVVSYWVGYGIELANGSSASEINSNWTVSKVTNNSVLQWIGIKSITTGKLIQVGIWSQANEYVSFYERYPNEDMITDFTVKPRLNIGKYNQNI